MVGEGWEAYGCHLEPWKWPVSCDEGPDLSEITGAECGTKIRFYKSERVMRVPQKSMRSTGLFLVHKKPRHLSARIKVHKENVDALCDH